MNDSMQEHGTEVFNRETRVLDHGYVRLIDSMGGDLSVVRAARVSYDAAWRAGENEGSDKRLIKYLADNGHTTPFESVEFQFEVKLPIFIARQWHRSRMWAYNELSARYRELPEEFYVPDVNQITTQSKHNKQMRSDEVNPHAETIRDTMQRANINAFATYRSMLEQGCPRELARTVLPLATYTHMFAKVDLLNLTKFLKQRLHSHAQYEIRVYAEALETLARSVAPASVGAWIG